MSATIPQGPDEYVLRQVAPPQELKLDPKYGSVSMVLPVGRLFYLTIDKPRAAQEGQAPKFSATALLNPKACTDIWKAIVMAANFRWPSEDAPNPQNPSELIKVNGEQLIRMGRLHSPLRNGEEVYNKSPQKHAAFRGLFSVNASTDADKAPVCYDERGVLVKPDYLYRGCYGRLHVTVKAFPRPGVTAPKSGVTVYLSAVQFARHGERLGGFDKVSASAAAFAAAGAIEVEDPAFGMNTGVPGAAAAPAGFAAPPTLAQQASWQPPTMGGGPFAG